MDHTISSKIHSEAIELYHAAYIGEKKNGIITLLHTSEEYTIVASGRYSSSPDNIWVFPLGGEKTSREFFKHIPPTPGEIEYAINFIEDEIIPIKKFLPMDSNLLTVSPVIRGIALQSDKVPASENIVLSIKEVEDVFSRLALIISGRPYSTDTLPESSSFAASLLILREFMHHWGFQIIHIKK